MSNKKALKTSLKYFLKCLHKSFSRKDKKSQNSSRLVFPWIYSVRYLSSPFLHLRKLNLNLPSTRKVLKRENLQNFFLPLLLDGKNVNENCFAFFALRTARGNCRIFTKGLFSNNKFHNDTVFTLVIVLGAFSPHKILFYGSISL